MNGLAKLVMAAALALAGPQGAVSREGQEIPQI